MDILDLKAFVMLAETLNFTRAAELMFVSQSTFSRQISRLETEMGTALFVRSPRAVALTDCGRVFLPEAKVQIAAWENTLRHMEQVRQGKMGGLTIGFVQDYPNDRFPELIRAYREAYPGVALTFREYGQASITQALEDGAVDVAFSFEEGVCQCDTVVYRELECSSICAVLWAENPLANREKLWLSELREMPIVVIRQEVSLFGYQNVMERCRRGGIQPEIAGTASIIPSLFMMIESDLGFAFLPESAKRIAPDGVRFVPLADCDDEIATVLAWRTDNRNPCLRGFLRIAEEI